MFLECIVLAVEIVKVYLHFYENYEKLESCSGSASWYYMWLSDVKPFMTSVFPYLPQSLLRLKYACVLQLHGWMFSQVICVFRCGIFDFLTLICAYAVLFVVGNQMKCVYGVFMNTGKITAIPTDDNLTVLCFYMLQSYVQALGGLRKQ